MRETATTPSGMLAFEKARERILWSIQPISCIESVELHSALGRILAHDIVSPINVPTAANSAMDGYAVAAESTAPQTAMAQIGTAHAGHPFAGKVGPGECVRIMTGAWLPAGTDAVVMQENADTDGEYVWFQHAPSVGENIRPAGDDICRNSQVLATGRHLRAADIGVLATMGTTEVTVVRRPQVAFFSTGDELRPPGAQLSPGQLFDSNGPMLGALLAEAGVECVDLGHVSDDPDSLAKALEKGANRADAIVSTGGVSVGDADYIREVLETKGSVDFWRVAIKPGKPLAFGKVGGAVFFGLPGNPVSAAVTFMQLVRPALAKLAGGRPAASQRHHRKLETGFNRKPGRTEFMRGQQFTGNDGEPWVRAFGHQGSGVLSSMSAADCFVVLEADSVGASTGSQVTVEPFEQRVWE